MGGVLRSIICYLGVNSQDVTGLWIREMINIAKMCFSPFVQATHYQTIKSTSLFCPSRKGKYNHYLFP